MMRWLPLLLFTAAISGIVYYVFLRGVFEARSAEELAVAQTYEAFVAGDYVTYAALTNKYEREYNYGFRSRFDGAMNNIRTSKTKSLKGTEGIYGWAQVGENDYVRYVDGHIANENSSASFVVYLGDEEVARGQGRASYKVSDWMPMYRGASKEEAMRPIRLEFSKYDDTSIWWDMGECGVAMELEKVETMNGSRPPNFKRVLEEHCDEI